MKVVKAYSFWDDKEEVINIKKWRTCLGNFNTCFKRVKGYSCNRLCANCKFQSDGDVGRKNSVRGKL